MSNYDEGSTLKSVAKWLVVGLLAIIGLRLAIGLLAVVFRFGISALFTVGPILLIGWVVLRLLRYFSRERTPVVS